MSRYRLYPEPWQAEIMLGHCGQARFIWNLGLDQQSWYLKGGSRGSAPGYVQQARQLTELRAGCGPDCEGEDCPCGYGWVGQGNADVQQQALKDLHQALSNFFAGTHGYPTWRCKYGRSEGFRVIGTDRIPVWNADGTPKLNMKDRQVIERRVRTEKVNRRWGRVKIPGCGWVKFRLTRKGLLVAKSFRITFQHGQWHIAFSGIVPDPIPAPGNGKTVGVDRGVTITAALSDGRALNCPQLTQRERARLRQHQRRASRAPEGSRERAAEYAKAARIKLREVNRRKDWCEKTSSMLAASFDVLRFEKLNIKNMTASAKGTVDEPGRNVRQKAGLNRAILAQGWGILRARTGHKAPGRVFDVKAPYTSLRCSDCGWIEKNSRKSQARFVCVSCGFTCNADTNASVNIDQAPAWQNTRSETRRGRTGRCEPPRAPGPVPAGQHPAPLGGGSSVREPQRVHLL